MARDDGMALGWGGCFILAFGGTMIVSSRLHLTWSLTSAAVLYAALLISLLIWALGRGAAEMLAFYGMALLFGGFIGVAAVDIRRDGLYLVGLLVYLALFFLSGGHKLKRLRPTPLHAQDASPTEREAE